MTQTASSTTPKLPRRVRALLDDETFVARIRHDEQALKDLTIPEGAAYLAVPVSTWRVLRGLLGFTAAAPPVETAEVYRKKWDDRLKVAGFSGVEVLGQQSLAQIGKVLGVSRQRLDDVRIRLGIEPPTGRRYA